MAFSTVFAPVREVSAEEFRRATEVTYLGFVHGTLAALHRMEPRGGGTIVQVGSALAYRGVPLQAAYCAAKHAIQGFHESLRCELLHDKSGDTTARAGAPSWNRRIPPGTRQQTRKPNKNLHSSPRFLSAGGGHHGTRETKAEPGHKTGRERNSRRLEVT